MTVIAPERAKVGYGLGTEEGEAFWLLGMLETIKIGGEDTGGQYGLVEIEVRAGEGSPGTSIPTRTSGSTSSTENSHSTSATLS